MGCVLAHLRNYFITEQEIDGEAFMELNEEDIKSITSKLGIVKKIFKAVKEVE